MFPSRYHSSQTDSHLEVLCQWRTEHKHNIAMPVKMPMMLTLLVGEEDKVHAAYTYSFRPRAADGRDSQCAELRAAQPCPSQLPPSNHTHFHNGGRAGPRRAAGKRWKRGGAAESGVTIFPGCQNDTLCAVSARWDVGDFTS